MTDQDIIYRLHETGHLSNPFGEYRSLPAGKELSTLKISDPLVTDAIESYKSYFAVTMEPLIAKHHPSRFSAAVRINGEVGPATREFFDVPRCSCPDYTPASHAVGSGNWKRCHQVGEFHSATVRFKGEPPVHVKPFIEDIWADVVDANADMGLLLKRDDTLDKADIEISFVNPKTVTPNNLRGGWIGLAIVGHGVRCGETIWQLYDRDYRPTDIRNEWTTLMLHEGGHNMGLSHSSGGIMNPYIIAGLKPTWRGDSSERIITNLYGGVRVPTVSARRKMVLAWQTGNQFDVIQEIPISGGNFWSLPN